MEKSRDLTKVAATAPRQEHDSAQGLRVVVNEKPAVEGKGGRWEGKDEENRFAKVAVRWCG
jgi:hypothetical protein